MAKKKTKEVPLADYDEDEDDLIGGEKENIPASGRKVSRKHNDPKGSGDVNSERLKSFIQRIEKLEEDKHALTEDLKDVYTEVKGSGFDVKVVRAIIIRRRKEANELREFEEILDCYLVALGMV